MKKILVLTAILAMAASSCFATDIATGASGTMSLANSTGLELHGDPTTATNATALIGKASTGVSVAWSTDTDGYALMTQHKSGTKAYGSSYDSTAIFQTTATNVEPGTPAYNSGAMTATDTTDFLTGWKAL
jgi:hypothetical protein